MSKLRAMSARYTTDPPDESSVSEARGSNSRRRMRVLALQVLYEIDSVRRNPDSAFESLLETWPLSDERERHAREIVKGAIDNLDRLDDLIARYAPSWPIEQLAVIDRNILRIAIYEMVIGRRTPPKVAINEAVEVAKVFGSDNSPRFVNGVLGSVLSEEEQKVST